MPRENRRGARSSRGLGINRASWSPDERAEYESILRDVVNATSDTTQRLDLYAELLVDAVQAQRYWAIDVQRANARHGAAAEIKRYQDRQATHALVSHDGRVLNLPAIQGTKVRTDAGDECHQRELIEVWTWAQIVEKRAEAIRARRVYADKIAHYDRLLVLREMCPGSVSPADAAERLGIVLEEFLGGVGEGVA